MLEERLHLLVVASKYEDEFAYVILHLAKEEVENLASTTAVLVCELVGLVDEDGTAVIIEHLFQLILDAGNAIVSKAGAGRFEEVIFWDYID